MFTLRAVTNRLIKGLPLNQSSQRRATHVAPSVAKQYQVCELSSALMFRREYHRTAVCSMWRLRMYSLVILNSIVCNPARLVPAVYNLGLPPLLLLLFCCWLYQRRVQRRSPSGPSSGMDHSRAPPLLLAKSQRSHGGRERGSRHQQ